MSGAKKGRDGLTHKQREYARLRAQGKSQIDAYTGAGYQPGATEKTRREGACRLETISAIQDKIESLQAIADAGGILSTEQRKCALVAIWQDDSNSTRDRLKALDLLNRMSGDYIDRREVSATVQGLTRADRIEAMSETLESLKTAWIESGGVE